MGRELGGSARLAFENLTVEHARPLARALTDPRVSALFPQPGPHDLEELEALFARGRRLR